MTNNLREAEHFLSVAGSDCGIANVSELLVLKSVVLGGEKKQVVVDVSQVQMHGKYICVVKPIQSITELLCLWHKESNLTCST
jgi:hypothetical protein